MTKILPMKTLPMIRKYGIADNVISDVAKYRAGIGTAGYGGCFYLAHFGALQIMEHGYTPLIQAGSMSWPIIDPKDDDGVCCTHFSYVWGETVLSPEIHLLVHGVLPEIHIWLAIRETGEIVDFSTNELKSQALLTAGLEWKAKDPPKFVWCIPDHLPEWVVYRPDTDAIKFVLRMLYRVFQPPYLPGIQKPLSLANPQP